MWHGCRLCPVQCCSSSACMACLPAVCRLQSSPQAQPKHLSRHCRAAEVEQEAFVVNV